MGTRDGGAVLRDAALELFAVHGYEGTSMRDIARAAAMSAPNVYNYVDSKEDLLWEIMAGTMTELLAGYASVMAANQCPVAQVCGFVEQHINYHATHRREAIVGNGQIESLDGERRERVKAFRREYEGGLRQMVERGAEAGLFAVASSRIAGYAILQMGIAISSWFRTDGPYTVAEIQAQYATFAMRMLGTDWQRHQQTCTESPACTPAPLHAAVSSS